MVTVWVGYKVGTVSFNDLRKDINMLRNTLFLANIPIPDI